LKPWELLKRRVAMAHPPWLEVEEHHVRLPDGREIPDWMWVRTPDFVNVVAVTGHGKWMVFRQVKYAVEGPTLAIVGGYVDDGEALQDAARRELAEETGYASSDWTHLGSYAVDGNRGCGQGHLFLARNCTPGPAASSDDLEEQEILLLDREQVKEALQAQGFGVMPWVAAVALALLETEGDRA
jgi:ADP-ribose pyrophosphatase